MILVSSCSCLCPLHWNQGLSREWRCSWSSADRRWSNYIWVINDYIADKCGSYIRGVAVAVVVQQSHIYQPLWRTTSTPSGKRPDRKPIPKPTCVLPLAILPGHPTAINPKSHPVSPAQPPLAQFLQPHPQGPGSPSNPPIRLGTAIAQFPSTPNHPTILGPTHPNALLPWWISPLDGHQFHLQPKNPPQPREALPAQPTRPVPWMPNASCVSGGVTQPCPVAAGRVSAFPVATSATCPEHVRHRIRVPVARQLPMADFPNT